MRSSSLRQLGRYFSLDRGTAWNRFRNGLPTVAYDGGREVAKLTGSKDPGLNRVMWDLQPKESLRAGSPADPTEYVAAGTYTVTLSASGRTLKTTLRVLEAPK